MGAHVSNIVALVPTEGSPAPLVSEIVVLVATGAPNSRYVDVGNAAALVSTHEEKVMAQVSEVVALVSYVSTETQRFNARAWGFTFDQHQFYVLHLGMQGTFVFDVLTNQWSQFQTQGFSGWNAEAGVEWNGEVYFGDNTLPTLWRMDPDSFLDDGFRLIRRVVTGGLPATGRDALTTGMFVLDAIREGAVDDESVPFVQLSISDDSGVTFRDREAIAVRDGTGAQDFSWRGLGTVKAPGRVYRITDEGGFVKIKGADQSIVGEDDGG